MTQTAVRSPDSGWVPSWVKTLATLAGGNVPWVASDFQNARYFDQVHGLTTLGAQWYQNLSWGDYDPAVGLSPGNGLTNASDHANPTLTDACAKALVGGPNCGPPITVLLRASGPNAQNNGWYSGRFDLPNYFCAAFLTVNNTTVASGANNYGNGIYAASQPDNPGFVATGVPLNGSHMAAVIYGDQSAKLSCGGGSIVNAALRPTPYTNSTNIGLSLVVPSGLSPTADYFLQLGAFWVGDLSAYLTALSA